ncbi:MAG: hypothetical protein WC389_20780, partial [Lutibacter sp.]
MYKVGSQAICERPIVSSFDLEMPISQFPWSVDIQSKDGGFIKSYTIGANNFFCDEVNFSLSEKGCLEAKLNLAKIDIPYYCGNQIIISYNGKRKYSGYVTNEPSVDEDSIKISPFSKRLKEVKFNSTFNNYTFPEMLSTTIAANSTNTGVLYNSFLVDYNDTSVYSSAPYKNENIEKLINDYYEIEDDSFWGVNADQYLYISKRSTVITKILYSGQNQAFKKLKITNDFSKIQYTRVNLFQKSTDTTE